MLMIMEGFEVSMRSRMLPEAMRVGSFTMFCSPKSLVSSSSLLCLLAVLLLVVWLFVQLISGRLKSPAMTTLGGVFCDLYSLVRESWRASRDWRWSFGGR